MPPKKATSSKGGSSSSAANAANSASASCATAVPPPSSAPTICAAPVAPPASQAALAAPTTAAPTQVTSPVASPVRNYTANQSATIVKSLKEEESESSQVQGTVLPPSQPTKVTHFKLDPFQIMLLFGNYKVNIFRNLIKISDWFINQYSLICFNCSYFCRTLLFR